MQLATLPSRLKRKGLSHHHVPVARHGRAGSQLLLARHRCCCPSSRVSTSEWLPPSAHHCRVRPHVRPRPLSLTHHP